MAQKSPDGMRGPRAAEPSRALRKRIVAISPDDGSAIDLHNPALAALLAWCVPGLGHLYQGRTLKGRLFMGAILGTFLLGMWLGGGRVVYASWKPGDTRWPFVCQAGAGVVADSDPASEDEECVNKASAILAAVADSRRADLR